MDSNLTSRGREFAAESVIVDTHLDVPYQLYRGWVDVSQTTSTDFDYPRARAGGLDVAFLAAYTPAEAEAQGRSRELAEQLIELVERVIDESPRRFAAARSPEEARSNRDRGLISLAIALENGSPLEGELGAVERFFDRGVRYITLCHNGTNRICDSSRDDPRWDGLSDFGTDVVCEMNRLGMMVDVSHASDSTFWDVMKTSNAPVIASHSSARHFTPGFERNIADDMMVALAEGGGAVMINFGSVFVSAEANAYSYAQLDAYLAHLAANGREDTREAQAEFTRDYESKEGPFPYADLEAVLDHFDHAIDLVGADHVGFGSDFDGLGDTLPVGLKDVSCYPTLIAGLLERGHSDRDVRLIAGENALRVWSDVRGRAANSGG